MIYTSIYTPAAYEYVYPMDNAFFGCFCPIIATPGIRLGPFGGALGRLAGKNSSLFHSPLAGMLRLVLYVYGP